MTSTHAPLHSSSLRTAEIVLSGHLTVPALNDAIRELRQRLKRQSERICLLYDCRNMTGYDREAREEFVAWHRQSASHVVRVAVVTENMLWHLVVSAMALASGKAMKPFDSMAAAQNWLNQ